MWPVLVLIVLLALWVFDLDRRVYNLERRLDCDRCNNRMNLKPGGINRLCENCQGELCATDTEADALISIYSGRSKAFERQIRTRTKSPG